MSTRNIKITVTQPDIDRGDMAECHTCPIALAFSRHLRPGFTPDIDGYKISVMKSPWKPGDYSPFFFTTTPMIAANFIATFDDAGPAFVSPFDFEISVPASADWCYHVS